MRVDIRGKKVVIPADVQSGKTGKGPRREWGEGFQRWSQTKGQYRGASDVYRTFFRLVVREGGEEKETKSPWEAAQAGSAGKCDTGSRSCRFKQQVTASRALRSNQNQNWQS